MIELISTRSALLVYRMLPNGVANRYLRCLLAELIIHPDPHGTSAARPASHAHPCEVVDRRRCQSVVLKLEARIPKQGTVDARGGSGGLDT